MSAIHSLPTPNKAGLKFDHKKYRRVRSTATLHRTRWSSDYRDVEQFDHTNDLIDYLNTLPSLPGVPLGIVRHNEPIKLDIPIAVAMKYNYMSVYVPALPTNSPNPSEGRWYFYFINDVVERSPQTTMFILQLDVMQTYFRDLVIGECYLESGHAGIADNKVVAGEPGILSISDGMDLGSDYVVSQIKEQKIADAFGGNYSVIVVSTTDLEGDYGTKEKPTLKSATGSDLENLPNGANIYAFENAQKFIEYMDIASSSPWRTSGIVDVKAIPPMDEFYSAWNSITLQGVAAFKPSKRSNVVGKVYKMYPNYVADILSKLPSRFQHLKKFASFPYTFFEVTTYTGESLVIKPELWNNKDATMVMDLHIAPPNQRLGFWPYNYNTAENAPQPETSVVAQANDKGERYNVATYISNLPSFSVVNDGYLMTMASQAHSIQQAYKSADWSQQKALAGAQASYDVGSSAMNLATDLNQSNVRAMADQTSLANTTTGLKALQSGVGSVVGGAMSRTPSGVVGGVIGAANAGLGAGIDIMQQNQSNAIQTRLANQNTSASVDNMSFARDTNKNLADFSARGDYSDTIKTLNAKYQDAKLTQPTTSGNTGGDAFMLANAQGWQLTLKVKQIPSGEMKSIGDYWLRYGYPVNRFMTPPANFKVCDTFSYWKMKETYVLSGECPEPIKQVIRGILEKGVTFWHKRGAMGSNSSRIVNKPIYGNYIPFL